MKKKINLQFLIMSVTAIILTLVISTLVSYEVLKDEVMEDLHTYARVLVETGAFSDMDHISYDAKEDGLRVTVIAEDGSVEYDSNANASDMDNHEKRPEIDVSGVFNSCDTFAVNSCRISAFFRISSCCFWIVVMNGRNSL